MKKKPFSAKRLSEGNIKMENEKNMQNFIETVLNANCIIILINANISYMARNLLPRIL